MRYNNQKRIKSTFTVTILLFILNCKVGYCDTIVPELSGGNGSGGWVLTNMNRDKDFWTMYSNSSSAETSQYYDFDVFRSVTIETNTRTYISYTYCTTSLEISTDGTNWIPLAANEHTAANIAGKTFTYTTSSLPYKRAKIRLVAKTATNNAGARLVSIKISGTPKFIPTPIGKAGSEINRNSFTCSWNRCNNATRYEVDLYQMLPGKTEKKILNEDFRNQSSIYSEVMDKELSVYLPGWSGKTIYFDKREIGNLKFLGIGTGSTPGSIETPPLNLAGNGGLFNLSFDIGSYSTANTSTVKLYINNKQTQTITVPITNLLPAKRINLSCTGGTESTSIKFEGTKGAAFVLDNITVTQLQDGIETSLPGYPVITEDSVYTATGMAPNTTYYFTVKATNGYITTNRSSPVSIKTLTGEQVVADSTTDRTFNNEIIDGDLCIRDGAKVRGKVTVSGEVSYVCKFSPDKWHSFSLPFIPRIVGGYIDGKRYALRANHDYLLKSYQNSGFTSTSLGSAGYIIKISSKIDNGELFFFSDKGITLNETAPFSLIGDGYSHLANPYTHSIDPKELVIADRYYCLKNNQYIETSEELLPFQSLIVYKGAKTAQPLNVISIESEMTNIPVEENEETRIWKEKGVLWIKGVKTPVTIYTAQGKVIFLGMINGNTPISLPSGIYLVRTNKLSTKISL